MTSVSMRFGTLALAVITAACGGQSPISPTQSLGAAVTGRLGAEAGVSGPLDLRALAGRVINVLSGAAAAGATVAIDGVGSAAADGAGDFALDSEAPDGLYRATASGAGVVSRQTTVLFPGQSPVISLIPATFNLAAYDQMVRNGGGEAGVMKRWLAPPALIIETSILDRDRSFEGNGFPGAVAYATDQQQSQERIDVAVAELTRALPLLSGGALTGFASIATQTTAAGAAMNRDAIGAIVVAWYPGADERCRGFAGLSYFDSYELASSYIFLQHCTRSAQFAPPERVISHELGHALGYGHVAGISSIMKAEVTDDITAFDRDAAVIAANRPPGNRGPDVDPDVPVNQPRRREGYARTHTRSIQ